MRRHVTGESRRRRQGLLAGAVIIVLVIAGVVGAVYQSRSSSTQTDPGGPLGAHAKGVLLNAIPIDTGEPVSVGLDLPTVHVDQLRLIGVTPIGASGGLRVMGYRVLRTEENDGGLGGALGFPPRGWMLHPLPGATITGDASGTQIVVGLEAEATGESHVLGFSVIYTLDGTRYRALVRNGLSCAPRGCTGRRVTSVRVRR